MDRFTFFRSFHDALKELPPDVRLEIFDAMTAYCFDDIDPNFKKNLAKSIWILIKPVLDNSRKQSRNGLKGGACIGNTNACKSSICEDEKTSQKQAKNKPKTSQKQPKNNPKTSRDIPMDNGYMDNKENTKQVSIPENIHTPTPEDEKYQNFVSWLQKDCPYIAQHLKPMTKAEFLRLKEKHSSICIMETCKDLENNKIKRKTYVDLYRTLQNWCKNNDYTK